MPTLKELNAQPGDVVMYDNDSKFTVSKDQRLFSHKFKTETNYSLQWNLVPYFTMVSRATQPNEIQVGQTYKVMRGDNYTAIAEDGNNVWMRFASVPNGTAYVWDKGGSAILGKEWDVDWGPVVVEGVDIEGDMYWESNTKHREVNFTVTTIDGKPDWTTLKVKES